MWNFRNNLIYLFCLLAAACTTEDTALPSSPDELSGDAIPIDFQLDATEEAANADETGTATRAGGIQLLPAGETVRVLVYKSGSTSASGFVAENTYFVEQGTPAKLTPCTVDANGIVTGVGEELFLTPNVTYDFHAYSSALPSADHRTVTNIGHGMNLVASKTSVTLNKFTPTVPLTGLTHQCAMLDFTVESDPADPSVLELSGKRITIKNMSRPPGSYTLGSSSGVVPASGMDAQVVMESFNKINDTRFGTSQIVLPKASGNFELEFLVLINGTEYTLKAQVNNLALQAKKKYTWKVICQRQGVRLNFSVAPWSSTASQESNVGTPAPLQQPANSFMVAPGMGVSFELKLPDGTAIPNAASVTRAELLWQTKDGAELMVKQPGHVVWDNAKKQIRVYTNSNAANGGTATIVAYTTSGTEVYRWLVWVTPYNPTGALNGKAKTINQSIIEGVLPTGAAVHTYNQNFFNVNSAQSVIMDRHLGGVQNPGGWPNDGCSFQYGSKTAYMSGNSLFTASGAAYTQPSAPGSTPTTSWNPISISGNVATVAKSNTDPCPFGWRVPPTNTWSGFDTTTFPVFNSGRQYGSGVNAYYPTGCWASNENSTNAFALSFNNLSVSVSQQPKTKSYSVRCAQDAILFPYNTPIMELPTLSNVAANSVVFNGRITSDGGATIREYGFYYATTSFVDGAGATKRTATNLNAAGRFSEGVVGLLQGTTYYLQAYVTTSENKTFYTPLVQFTPTGAAKVTILTATPTAHDKATVTARVDDDGGEAGVKRGVIYSTTPNFDPDNQGTAVEATSTGKGNFSINLTGLQPGTVYYVCAYVVNKLSKVYATQRNFLTPGIPTLTNLTITKAETDMPTSLSAKLTGPIPPGVTEWGFEYSKNANFPTGAETVKIVVAGPYTLNSTFVASNLAGLAYGTTYYVRAYAVNPVGKGCSAIQQCTTPVPPTVTTLATGGGNQISKNNRVPVTLNGQIQNTGSTTILERGFEYSTIANFVGGTGTKVYAGTGANTKFAAISSSMKDGIMYYIRAYATNKTATSYGDVVSFRLNYVAPTFNGVTLQVTERKINSLYASISGTSQAGNAEVIAQGYAYKEEGSSGYIYSETANPRLKVYKKYTIYAYIENAKGTYYSPANTSGTTYKNYVLDNDGKEYVVDKASGEGNEAWATGIGSLVFKYNDLRDGGYYMTQKLVNGESWAFHPNAAKFCWRKQSVYGQKWFLPTLDILHGMNTIFGIEDSKDHSPEIRLNRDNKYWSSEEDASMTASFISHWGSNVWGGLILGKNEKLTVRCYRKRVLPYDEYAY